LVQPNPQILLYRLIGIEMLFPIESPFQIL
jgi:hypothetical protein